MSGSSQTHPESTASADPLDTPRSKEVFTLAYAVFVAGLCSIVYELLIATTAAYFMGDAVLYFSLTIGFYMAAMGIGAFLSKYIRGNIMAVFVSMEVALGFLGGFAIPVLYFAYSANDTYFIVAYVFFTVSLGILIGLEIPFLTRLLQDYTTLRVNIAHVLSLDYFGALVATLAFPLVMLPFMGTFKSGLTLGLINMSIGLMVVWMFPKRIGKAQRSGLIGISILIAALIVGGIVFSSSLLHLWDSTVYESRILYATQTRYQKIVLTKDRNDVRLYLDGNLQFSALDEYRYHEALVHVPLTLKPDAESVLMLGGGDGMGVREVLKHTNVKRITLVDLDAEVLRIARENPYVKALNKDSFADPRVRVITADAFAVLKEQGGLYDVIIADLPDPNNTELARLYTRAFYRAVAANLAPDGLFVTQSTSPFYAAKAFWCINATIKTVFAHAEPYHVLVPSFGDWGFVVAGRKPIDVENVPELKVETRFLDRETLQRLFSFDKDQPRQTVEPSTLDRPIILTYYLEGWRHWGR